MAEVSLYTDGSCLGNSGPGGWAAILQMGPHHRELAGGESHTTNDRMELTAVIEGLSALKRPSNVDVYTDSQYIAKAFNSRKTRKNDPENWDLWERLLELTRIHQVEWHLMEEDAEDKTKQRERAAELVAQEAKKIQFMSRMGSQGERISSTAPQKLRHILADPILVAPVRHPLFWPAICAFFGVLLLAYR